jgi:opacity protein-like surface antigen
MKKNLLFVIITLFIVSLATAQIPKGSLLLGGGVNFGNTKFETGNNISKQNNFNISGSVGIAIKENTFLGGFLNYGHSEFKNNNTPGKPENTSYGGGVFFRKYLLLGKKFYLFGEAGLGYSNSRSSQISGIDLQTTAKGWNVNLSVSPGISYALTKKFHLELGFNELLGIGYSKTKTENISLNGRTNSINTSFGFRSNLGTNTPLNIGFRFLFSK